MNKDDILLDSPCIEYINNEEEKLFNNFCVFISLLKDNNPNIANIFLDLLQNKYERIFFKKMLGVETDMDVVNLFVKFAPQIIKSKYVFKKLNKGNVYKK